MEFFSLVRAATPVSLISEQEGNGKNGWFRSSGTRDGRGKDEIYVCLVRLVGQGAAKEGTGKVLLILGPKGQLRKE